MFVKHYESHNDAQCQRNHDLSKETNTKTENTALVFSLLNQKK